jgi:hypothetical protein
MKVAGVTELESALARVRRLHALGRISNKDKVYIEGELDLVLTRIRKMEERDEEGRVIVDAE